MSKKTAAELRVEQNNRLRQYRAERRLKISPEEAIRRRKVSIKKIRMFEIVSIAILTAVLVGLSFLVLDSLKPEAENEAAINAMILFWGAISLQAALMIRAGFIRQSKDDLLSEDRTDHPFRGWRLTYFTPLLGFLILIPAIAAGVFNDDSGNLVGSVFMVLLMNFGALLMGALVAAFIVAPIDLIVRGIIALVKGDKSRSGYIVFGLIILVITTFIFVGSAAVSPDAPYPVGSGQILFALLGIPGNYDVKSEALLWVARGIIVGLVLFFVWLRYAGKPKASAKQG